VVRQSASQKHYIIVNVYIIGLYRNTACVVSYRNTDKVERTATTATVRGAVMTSSMTSTAIMETALPASAAGPVPVSAVVVVVMAVVIALAASTSHLTQAMYTDINIGGMVTMTTVTMAAMTVAAAVLSTGTAVNSMNERVEMIAQVVVVVVVLMSTRPCRRHRRRDRERPATEGNLDILLMIIGRLTHSLVS